MKVYSITTINKSNFKKNTPHILGYDDSISKEKREYIRYHIEQTTQPYQNIYEKEPPLEEYQLKKLMNFFAQKPKNIDGDSLFELPLYNVHNISTTQRYKPNIYRGSTLYGTPERTLEKIKNAGIKTVINLAGYGNDYKEKINAAGLNYYHFDIYQYIMSNNIDKIKQKDKLVEFIKEMQKEYVYMGCEYGTYKTDVAVFLNTLFNPKVKGYCKIYSPDKIIYVPKTANEIYKNMTNKDKKELGWTKEFEKQFNKKLQNMLD